MFRTLITLALLTTALCAKQRYDVLSLSSAIIDHCFLVSDKDLETITNDKGGWAPIDHPTLASLLNKNFVRKKLCSGGSGVNVLKGLAHLGQSCAVIGKIGSDDMGSQFVQMIENLGIHSFLQKGPLPTGQALCFITPDGERTFRTYLGASHSLSDLAIDPALFRDIKLFHIEGYQLVEPELFLKAMNVATSVGATVVIDLANAEIVRRNKDFIMSQLPHIDILFANEVEAKELTGLPAHAAAEALSKHCRIAIVTMSEKGCWVQSGNQSFFTPALPVPTVDTTGAGDLFAAGFLHGYLSRQPLEKCACLGALVASRVVTVIGADIPYAIWEELAAHPLLQYE